MKHLGSRYQISLLRVNVIRVSDPPTAQERLQLLAVRLQRSLVAIMSHRCETVEEWIARFESLGSY